MQSSTPNSRGRSYSMGSSQRMTYPANVLKNDIELHGSAIHAMSIGPGQYFPDMSVFSLVKRSFNIRALPSYTPKPRKSELHSPRQHHASRRHVFQASDQLSPIPNLNHTI